MGGREKRRRSHALMCFDEHCLHALKQEQTQTDGQTEREIYVLLCFDAPEADLVLTLHQENCLKENHIKFPMLKELL